MKEKEMEMEKEMNIRMEKEKEKEGYCVAYVMKLLIPVNNVNGSLFKCQYYYFHPGSAGNHENFVHSV